LSVRGIPTNRRKHKPSFRNTLSFCKFRGKIIVESQSMRIRVPMSLDHEFAMCRSTANRTHRPTVRINVSCQPMRQGDPSHRIFHVITVLDIADMPATAQMIQKLALGNMGFAFRTKDTLRVGKRSSSRGIAPMISTSTVLRPTTPQFVLEPCIRIRHQQRLTHKAQAQTNDIGSLHTRPRLVVVSLFL
jgi:hypothetical protein